jgi:hypothetical protein
VLDTSTNLEWLKLPAITGQTPEQISAHIVFQYLERHHACFSNLAASGLGQINMAQSAIYFTPTPLGTRSAG